MVLTTQHLVAIYLSVFILVSTGIEVKYVKYCGPPDKTFKFHITPWPVLTPGEPLNVSVTFTPAVDIFSTSLLYEVKMDGKSFTRGSYDVPCDKLPQICNLAAGETYSVSHNFNRLKSVPPGLKGTFTGKLEIYNEEQVMWSCLEGEIVV